MITEKFAIKVSILAVDSAVGVTALQERQRTQQRRMEIGIRLKVEREEKK